MSSSSVGLRFLLVFFLLACAAVAWNTIHLIRSHHVLPVGDGRHLASYGFDLSACRIPQEQLIPSGLPKDGLTRLDNPPFMLADEVLSLNEKIRGKYLVSSDRVAGVSLNGDTRVYPLRVLCWHEVINDTVGGTPITVTYSPLCDSLVVFSREVNGEVLEFGVSGLLYNSNLVMYDRRTDARPESLWSPLQFRAISGPAADRGDVLTPLPCTMTRWDEWKTRYPQSKVIQPSPERLSDYQHDPYGSYQSSDHLKYPVSPLPSPSELTLKSPLLIVGIHQNTVVIPYSTIEQHADENGVWKTEWDGEKIWFSYTAEPPTAQVNFGAFTEPPITFTAYSYYFAWYALHESIPWWP